jgi:hypothetical protein
MATTPTSYDPQFWSSAVYRGLDLYASGPIEEPLTVARFLVEYFRQSSEKPTHFSYQVIGAKQRKLKTKTLDKILEKMAPVEGRLESMYIESIRDDDHTHAVASLGYNYDTIGRENSKLGAHCFKEDFDLSTARHLACMAVEDVTFDYGFSICQRGIINSVGFGIGLRIDSDPFSAKRERWLKDFRRKEPRQTEVPFLDVFEINLLSDLHLSKNVAGKPFEAYVREKGLGTLEPVGKANFLWCLEADVMGTAKADLAQEGLVALV